MATRSLLLIDFTRSLTDAANFILEDLIIPSNQTQHHHRRSVFAAPSGHQRQEIGTWYAGAERLKSIQSHAAALKEMEAA
jgi:hypothetical protein